MCIRDRQTETVTIPDHTLYGDYLPKIAESEIKPVTETGEIVLSRVVVPQTIVVHDGAPTNASAPDYYVPYRDYIKNVASSEIYATWPRSAIVANVLALSLIHISFYFREFQTPGGIYGKDRKRDYTRCLRDGKSKDRSADRDRARHSASGDRANRDPGGRDRDEPASDQYF